MSAELRSVKMYASLAFCCVDCASEGLTGKQGRARLAAAGIGACHCSQKVRRVNERKPYIAGLGASGLVVKQMQALRHSPLTAHCRAFNLNRRRLVRVSPVASMAGVQEYIDKHNLQKKVEDVLNSCVKARPEEPLSFMVCRRSRSTSTAPKLQLIDLHFCQQVARGRRSVYAIAYSRHMHLPVGKGALGVYRAQDYQDSGQADLRLSREPYRGGRCAHPQGQLQGRCALRGLYWYS